MRPPLIVRSGWIRSYKGVGGLDVTRGSGSRPGLAFAPSRELLELGLTARKHVAELCASAQRQDPAALALFDLGPSPAEIRAEAAQIDALAWENYRRLFLSEMRVSAGMRPDSPRWTEDEEIAHRRGVVPNVAAWRALLSGELAQVEDGRLITVALCYCGPTYQRAGRCHAVLLRELWAKMGAEDGGQVPERIRMVPVRGNA